MQHMRWVPDLAAADTRNHSRPGGGGHQELFQAQLWWLQTAGTILCSNGSQTSLPLQPGSKLNGGVN